MKGLSARNALEKKNDERGTERANELHGNLQSIWNAVSAGGVAQRNVAVEDIAVVAESAVS
jgi:hypothetical protein